MDSIRTAGMPASRHQLVALYRSEAAAQTARQRLLAEGIPAAHVQIAAPPAEAKQDHEGLMAKVKSFFASSDERLHGDDVQGYAESLRRGHAMLIVRTGPELEQRAIIVLENTEPLDLDTHMQAWRTEGWQARPEAASSGIVAAPAPKPEPAAPRKGGDREELARARAELDRLDARQVAAIPQAAAAAPPALARSRMEPPATLSPPPRAAEPAMPAARHGADDAGRIPVFEEQLHVGKRAVGHGAVRVRSYVVEQPAEARVTLHEERVHLERHKVDRLAGVAGQEAFRERTIEVAATREEPVIEKQVHVVEEIEIRKETSERVETVRDTVRHTEVRVEDTDGETPRT